MTRKRHYKKKKKATKASSKVHKSRTPASGIARSICACKRCRIKKIKCSLDFPKCKNCEQAGVECVSVDPVTGRAVPRSYIVYLETQVKDLQAKLKDATKVNTPVGNEDDSDNSDNSDYDLPTPHSKSSQTPEKSDIVSESANSVAPPSFFGASSCISFAKLMFTALNFKGADDGSVKVTEASNGRNGSEEEKKLARADSLKGPHAMKAYAKRSKMALLPPKQQAMALLSLYFSESNSQVPIFHRELFLRRYYQPIYGDLPEDCNLASSFTSINRKMLVHIDEEDTWYHRYTEKLDEETSEKKQFDPLRFSATVKVPRKFRKPLFFMNIVFAIASSVVHLQYPDQISEEFKNSALRYIDDVYSSPNRLEALQAVMCLTLYSLMRPCIPGCWYLLGSALRLTVDLGLHWEYSSKQYDPFTMDMRRRLFWSCYSLDRQICVYLGRPFGIPEESCHVPFPSLLDDSLIDMNCEKDGPDYARKPLPSPSYKCISVAMIRIRMLQAEIQLVMYDQKDLPRKFKTMDEWYRDISRRLDAWIASVPQTQQAMNCTFTSEFFSLNYHHARIMLNGLSPKHYTLTEENYLILLDASKEIILCYYQLFRRKMVNYTWAATHNLFMAGTSFLYSVFNCDAARKAAPLAEVQKVVSYCNIVLGGLKERCDAASHCRKVFEILTAAVIKIKYTDKIIHSVNLSKITSSSQDVNETNTLKEKPTGLIEQQESQIMYPVRGGSLPVNSFRWSTNEEDLDKFFDEVEGIESPSSSSRSSKNAEITPQVFKTQSGFSDLNVSTRETSNQNENAYPDYQAMATDVEGDQPLDNSEAGQQGNTSYPRTQMDKLGSPSKVDSKEGQKLFKMMYQIPTDSIWEQFFTSSFNGSVNPLEKNTK